VPCHADASLARLALFFVLRRLRAAECAEAAGRAPLFQENFAARATADQISRACRTCGRYPTHSRRWVHGAIIRSHAPSTPTWLRRICRRALSRRRATVRRIVPPRDRSWATRYLWLGAPASRQCLADSTLWGRAAARPSCRLDLHPRHSPVAFERSENRASYYEARTEHVLQTVKLVSTNTDGGLKT
jgi:hypothetical protein